MNSKYIPQFPLARRKRIAEPGKLLIDHARGLRVVPTGSSSSLREAGALLLAWLAVVPMPGRAATYEVGPGQALADLSSVPWASLGPGDRVLVHARATPYREKWVICRQGTAAQPIVVSGVPDAQGNLPVISGDGATTAAGLNYWGEERGIIKIGGANTPADTLPAHIVIENLVVGHAYPALTFTGDNGATNAYASNAAAVYVEKGSNITVRNCTLFDCGNGFFVGPFGGQSAGITVESCTIYSNGIAGSIYEHNNYTEARGILFQFNRFGPLRSGAGGNNLKDRSGGCVIRYNWIEGGNRQLDLVDSAEPSINTHPSYSNTYVYANVLVEPGDEGNNQIVHYGGDSGDTAMYRKGRLHFHNNTVVSRRTGNTTLFRLSSAGESADAFGNIVYVTQTGSRLAMLAEDGSLRLQDNWTKPGWVGSHGTLAGTITNLGGNLTGASPGFVSEALSDFHLTNGSPCIDAAIHAAADGRADKDGTSRPLDGNGDGNAAMDIGAYEFAGASADTDGDGQQDAAEVIAATDATNSASFFAVARVAPGEEGSVVMAWRGAPGRAYRLEGSMAATGSWAGVDALGEIPGSDAEITVTTAAPERVQIYRTLVTVP